MGRECRRASEGHHAFLWAHEAAAEACGVVTGEPGRKREAGARFLEGQHVGSPLLHQARELRREA